MCFLIFVTDCVGQNYWKSNMASIGMDGKWIIYGFLSGNKVPVNVGNDENVGYFDIGPILRKRVQIIGTTLRSRDEKYKKELVEDFEKHILPLIYEKKIAPICDCEFEMKNANEAHLHVKQNKNIGKVVLYWHWK